MYRNFCYKKNKIKWVGSLEDLKAVVLKEVDKENFEGEKSEEMSKRIISLINQDKNASMSTSFNQGKVSDEEPARSRVAEQT